MQQKFNDLLITCCSSLFSAICLIIFGLGAIAFALFNITLAIIFELIVQLKKKAKLIIQLMQTYIHGVWSNFIIRSSKFKLFKHEVRHLWTKVRHVG